MYLLHSWFQEVPTLKTIVSFRWHFAYSLLKICSDYRDSIFPIYIAIFDLMEIFNEDDINGEELTFRMKEIITLLKKSMQNHIIASVLLNAWFED